MFAEHCALSYSTKNPTKKLSKSSSAGLSPDGLGELFNQS